MGHNTLHLAYVTLLVSSIVACGGSPEPHELATGLYVASDVHGVADGCNAFVQDPQALKGAEIDVRAKGSSVLVDSGSIELRRLGNRMESLEAEAFDLMGQGLDCRGTILSGWAGEVPSDNRLVLQYQLTLEAAAGADCAKVFAGIESIPCDTTFALTLDLQ